MSAPAPLLRPRLDIDLAAIAANWRELARRAAPADCAAVVKADAYGLGLAPVARALAAAGCTTFFVARPEEGVALRAILKEARILVLDGLAGRPPAAFLEAGLEPVVGSLAELRAWRAARARAGLGEEIVLLIDTGLTRLGLDPAELEAHPMNRRQLERFRAALALLPRARASLAASSGIFLGEAFRFDLVRPGAALYGVAPTPGRGNPMRPVLRLTAPVLRVHEVGEPGAVGYGASFSTRAGMRIAVLPVGYADGYPRAAGGRARALVAGCEVPVVGRVSMDLLTLEVSALPAERVGPGTPVELLGERFGVDDLAEAAGTIGYEILTRLGRRFERRYLGGQEG
ncbi:MAG: alanine racemase [Geminicoccaceae bacterium]|nr:alanine racemase [Geminicoccaceae bacterium]MDW8370822.1 alanine racemase [Geminicoccaceae bacterium]